MPLAGTVYDADILKDIHKMVGDGKVIVDAGANRGLYTKYFLDEMNASKVHAFEIIPDLFPLTDERIELYPFGLSARESEVELIGMIPDTKGAFWFWYTDEETETPKQMGYPKHQHDDELPKMKFQTKTLDSCVQDKVSFIKIDVEGMEMEVLKGASSLISRDHPLMYIEVCRKNQNAFKNWCYKNQYVKIDKKGPCVLVGVGL